MRDLSANFNEILQQEVLGHQTLANTAWSIVALDHRGEMIGDASCGNPSGHEGVPLEFDELSFAKISLVHALSAHDEDLTKKVRIDESNKVPGGDLAHVPNGLWMTRRTLVELAATRSDNTAFKALALDIGVDRINEASGWYGHQPTLTFVRGENGVPDRVIPGKLTALQAAWRFKTAMQDGFCREVFSRSGHRRGMRRIIEATTDGPGREDFPRSARLASLVLLRRALRFPVTEFPNKNAFWIPQAEDNDRLGGQFHEVAAIGNIIAAAMSSGHDIATPESPDHPAYRVLGLIGQKVLYHADP